MSESTHAYAWRVLLSSQPTESKNKVCQEDILELNRASKKRSAVVEFEDVLEAVTTEWDVRGRSAGESVDR